MGFINTDASSYSKGRAAVASNKDDMTLDQHGGEGGGKEGDVEGGHDDIGFTPGVTPNVKYTGKGRMLNIEEF